MKMAEIMDKILAVQFLKSSLPKIAIKSAEITHFDLSVAAGRLECENLP